MKKQIAIGAAFAILANAAFALDMSYDTSRDQSIKKDKSMSVKKGSEKKTSNRNFDTDVDSKSYAADVVFDPMPIYKLRAHQCVQSIAVAADFGLTSVIDDEEGIIDLNRKAYIENASANAMRVSQIPGAREGELKKYIACVVDESARMAQANLNLQSKLGTHAFSARQIAKESLAEFSQVDDITDPSIRMQLVQAHESLKQPCRFVPSMGKDSVQCGTLTFSFVDNSVKNAGTAIAGAGALYGVAPSFRVSLSETDTDGREVARESSQSSSRDASMTQTGSSGMSRSQKQQLNVAPFLPK